MLYKIMKRSESVGIVIVNYNGEAYQNECIKSLYQMKYSNFKIIVVDSGSTDNSLIILKEQFPEVIVLEQFDNVGVAKGNNIGINYSIKLGMKYTLLLNNDTEVDSLLLSKLVENATPRTVTVPKIYYYDPSDLLWYAGGELDWRKITGTHEGYRQKEIAYGSEKSRLVTYSPTCCMLIDNSIFLKTGLMDENYFMYYDDTDFCVRLNENGINILYISDAKIWHKVSSSTGGEGSRLLVYYSNRNCFYYTNKYRNKISNWAIIKKNSFLFIKWCCSLVYKKNNRLIKNAYLDYKREKMGRCDSY